MITFARAVDRRSLLAFLAISTFRVAWITLASGSFNLRSAVFLLVLPWVLLRTGGIITAALRVPSFFALDFLLGVAVVSVGVMAWKIFVPFSLWVPLIILLIAVAGIPKLFPHHQRDPLSALGLLSVIASLAAATAWCQDLLLPTSSVQGGIVFKPWKDFFFHATIVARSVGDQTLYQVGNFEWKGFPAIIYHYASYSLASCLAKMGHLPAYDTVVGFWAPFGSFLIGLASYALGRAIWGQGAGLAALVATFLIPDGVMLTIAHPYYGYFWLQHIAPGGLYGVAIAGTALILIIQGMREGRRVWIVSGVAVGALVAFFKVHIFAAAFPLLFSFAILAWPPRKRLQWLVLGACVAVGAALLTLANYFHVGPDVYFDFSGGAWYWKVLANWARGTHVESWYQIFHTAHPFPSYLAQAIGLLLVNALGIFAVVAPLVWLLAVWCKTWQVSESISVAAIAILLLMTFGLSGNAMLGNPDELIHRPFVWAYWLVGSLAAGRLFSMVAGRRPQPPIWAVAVGILALMIVPIWYGSGLDRAKWSGAGAFSSLRVDRGLVDCAHYIRGQLPTTAVAQDSRLDELLILGGLGERRSFAARPKLWMRASKVFRESPYQEQLRRLQSLEQATNVPDLQRSVRETGIRWYVVHPGDSYPWPTEFRDRPLFESNGYKVYDMQRCFDLRG
jgi:xanthosine utilization system XapX-like protein